MTLVEALDGACKKDTLLDAISYITAWETERAIKQAGKYDRVSLCHKYLIKEVLDRYRLTSYAIDYAKLSEDISE